MSQYSTESIKTNAEERLKRYEAKMKKEKLQYEHNQNHEYYSGSGRGYTMTEFEEDKQSYTRDHSNSSDLIEDKFKDSPNNKPKPGSFYNAKKEPLAKENSNVFEPAFWDIEPEGKRRIQSIVKLVNARDPPNKYFESTVNLANKDAWKRRSIYLSKANMNFEPDNVNNSRHTIHTAYESPNLNREDSWDDDLWDNTDEGIGEFDRVIPVIGVPKCLSALKDKSLPPGIQKMLKQSTRFSHSFHVGGNPVKDHRDTSIRGFNKDKPNNRNRRETEESKAAQAQRNKSMKEFFGYKNYAEMQRNNPSEFEDASNFGEEAWIREKTLHHQKDSLNQYDNNTVFSKNSFQENKDQNEVNDVIEPVNHSKQRDSLIDKIEEIDNKKKAISQMDPKPKKRLSNMVSKATPFAVAPTNNQKVEENIPENHPNRVSRGPSLHNNERESVDVFRASDNLDKGKRSSQMTEPEQAQNKDELLDEWLNRGKGDNNTIIEDVDAENYEDSNRFSKSSRQTNTSHRMSNVVNPQDEEDEEEENELHKIHMLQSLQALQYMKNVPVPPISELSDKMVFLPPPKQPHLKKTLIFDMDETLIHCVDDIEEENPQVVLDVVFDDGEIVDAGINVRPYAIDCLKAANELFQVIVFTASHKCYADVVLDHIDPTGELIQYRLYRDSWFKTEDNVYIKDLRIIQNRELWDLVIVDNAVYSFGFQLDNGIPIIPYYEDPEDEELYHLIPYLEILAEGDDVRTKNREAFQLREMAQENTSELEYFEK